MGIRQEFEKAFEKEFGTFPASDNPNNENLLIEQYQDWKLGARWGFMIALEISAQIAESMKEFRKSNNPEFMHGEAWACSDVAKELRQLSKDLSTEGEKCI